MNIMHERDFAAGAGFRLVPIRLTGKRRSPWKSSARPAAPAMRPPPGSAGGAANRSALEKEPAFYIIAVFVINREASMLVIGK